MLSPRVGRVLFRVQALLLAVTWCPSQLVVILPRVICPNWRAGVLSLVVCLFETRYVRDRLRDGAVAFLSR